MSRVVENYSLNKFRDKIQTVSFKFFPSIRFLIIHVSFGNIYLILAMKYKKSLSSFKIYVSNSRNCEFPCKYEYIDKEICFGIRSPAYKGHEIRIQIYSYHLNILFFILYTVFFFLYFIQDIYGKKLKLIKFSIPEYSKSRKQNDHSKTSIREFHIVLL
jgi:hypothetical protein